MLAYLQGKIILKKQVQKKDRFIVLELGGKGYKIFLSKKNFENTPKLGENFKVFCYLYVRENILALYGFLNWEERELFEILLDISGVGPKAGLEISSLGPLEKLKKSIERGNQDIFDNVLGIGRKKAKKIILELSGKIGNYGTIPQKQNFSDDPAFSALINLGFSKRDVEKVLSEIPREMGTEQKIKQSLKLLGQ